MRQKRIKYVNETMLFNLGVVVDVSKLNIDDNKKVHLEVGSGKGQFITTMAKDHPDELFIAMEMNMYVLYRIVQKKIVEKLDNLIIILGDAKNLLDYLDAHTIDHIYLNFSDPWPKTKHHKRRLTYPSFLDLYVKVLKSGGTFQQRTDHYDFFKDSKDYIETKFDIYDVTHDLGQSTYMTEYETRKRKLGPIYQLKGQVKSHDEEDI